MVTQIMSGKAGILTPDLLDSKLWGVYHHANCLLALALNGVFKWVTAQISMNAPKIYHSPPLTPTPPPHSLLLAIDSAWGYGILHSNRLSVEVSSVPFFKHPYFLLCNWSIHENLVLMDWNIISVIKVHTLIDIFSKMYVIHWDHAGSFLT